MASLSLADCAAVGVVPDATDLAGIIRGGDDPTGDGTRRVHVCWEGDIARWYPIAVRILRQLVLDPEPVECVPELTLPFTFPIVREADDPWAAACGLCPGRYTG